MALAQAESRNKAIDGLANGMATGSQHTVITRCFARQVAVAAAAGLEHFEPQKQRLDLLRCVLVVYTLEHFAHDDVRQCETLLSELPFQPVGFSVLDALQVVDPDGSVDNDHDDLLGDSGQT